MIQPVRAPSHRDWLRNGHSQMLLEPLRDRPSSPCQAMPGLLNWLNLSYRLRRGCLRIKLTHRHWPGDVKQSSELCHWELWIQGLLPQGTESSASSQMGTEMLPKPHPKGDSEIWTLVFDLWILKPFAGRRTELSVIYPGIIKLSWTIWRAVLIRKQKVTLDVSVTYWGLQKYAVCISY